MAPFAQLIERDEVLDLQEHWRLLYVALTRAADRLIVSGVAPRPKKDGSDARPENCWHRAVQAAMASLNVQPIEDGDSVKLVYASEGPVRARKLVIRLEPGDLARQENVKAGRDRDRTSSAA